MGLDGLRPNTDFEVWIHRNNLCLSILTIKYNIIVGEAVAQNIVRFVDEKRTALSHHMSIERLLCLDDVLLGAESLNMRYPNVGDESEVGIRNLAQVGNLPDMVRTHLHDGHLVCRLDGEQRQRHSYMVIEVPFRASGFVSR